MMKAMGYALGALGLGGCGFFVEKTADPEKAAFNEFFLYPRDAAVMPYRKSAKEHLTQLITYLKSTTSPQESPDGRVYRAIFGNVVVEHCEGERGYTKIRCEKFFRRDGASGKYTLEMSDNDMNGVPDPNESCFKCGVVKMRPEDDFEAEIMKFFKNGLKFVANNKVKIFGLMVESLNERRGEDIDIFSQDFISRLHGYKDF